MSLHQVSLSDHQRAEEVRARKLRMGSAPHQLFAPEPAPKSVPTTTPPSLQNAICEWNCLQYYLKCFEPAPIELKKKTIFPTSENIIRGVCRYYGFSYSDVLSHRKHAPVTRVRQIAMWLVKELTVRSLPEIGMRFDNRDHTTILHGVRKINTLRKTDPELQAELDHLVSVLRPVSPEDNGNAENSSGTRS